MPKQKTPKPQAKKTAPAKAPKNSAGKSSKPRPAKLISAPVEVPAKPAPTHDEIAAKAYEIWLEKGRPIGQDEANWAEAVEALS